MRKIHLKLNQKLLFEFISVAFAVFLGLMLNQWKENRNCEKLAEKSLRNIQLEIEDNSTTVQEMLKSHRLILSAVDSLLTLIENPEEHGDTKIDLNFQLISSTSWETAKLTQAIAYIDVEIVNDIAGVYEFQSYYEEIVKVYVLNNIYTKPKHRDKLFLENIKNLLISIIPIESSLIDYYNYLQTELLADYIE